MDEKLKFSIIVPCYNVEMYIEECVMSVLNQTYSNWELILVDDESTDSTFSIIERLAELDSRIFACTKKHGGLPHTRNYGFNFISGDYLVLLDGDDYIKDDYLENDSNLLMKNQIDMLIHNQHTCFTVDNIWPVILFDIPTKQLTNSQKLQFIFSDCMYFPAAAVLSTYRVDFLKDNGIKYGEQYSCSEDLDYFYEVISKNPNIEFANYEFYFYRQDNQYAMTKCMTSDMELDRLRIYKKWFDYFHNRKIEDFDCSAVLKRISRELVVQVFVCHELKKTGNDIYAKKFLIENRYLFKYNNFENSFWCVYIREYFINPIVNYIKTILKRY